MLIVGAAINIVTWWATQPVGAAGAASLLSVVRYVVKLLLTALFPVLWVGASVTALRLLGQTSQHHMLAAFGALLQAYQIGQYSHKWPRSFSWLGQIFMLVFLMLYIQLLAHFYGAVIRSVEWLSLLVDGGWIVLTVVLIPNVRVHAVQLSRTAYGLVF